MSTITPKNWSSFQHYKDRKPAWIKLHRDILDNYEFHCLPVASRALAPCLWLLASEYEDGAIPANWGLIAFRLRMSEQEVESAVTPLIEKGFFIASGALADRKQSACLEKEKEREKQDQDQKLPTTSVSSAKADDENDGDDEQDDGQDSGDDPGGKVTDLVPYQKLVDAYNERCGELFPRVSKLTDKRRRKIRAAWKFDTTNQDERRRTNSLDYWSRYFDRCTNVEHFRKAALGENTGQHAGWMPGFDFLIREDTWLGVREGRYAVSARSAS